MNYENFKELYLDTEFDEIKIIGRDIEKEGRPYHIIGMLLKNKKAVLYVLELNESTPEECIHAEKTRREQLKSSIQSERNRSLFMSIREFQYDGSILEVDGATADHCINGEYSEAYILFTKMMQAGWKIAEDSPFYDLEWDNLVVTKIAIRDEMECLPDWNDDVQVVYDVIPKESLIELPVTLESGKTTEIDFSLQDGRRGVCDINKIQMMDVWDEVRKRFEDTNYRKCMLENMSEDEFEKMKKHFFEALSEDCPQGMYFPVIEYECTEDISLNFYDRKYLDGIEKPKKGSATAIFMMAKPDAETGSHGLKMRACVIQVPMEIDVLDVDAELFSYSEMLKKRTESIYLKKTVALI